MNNPPESWEPGSVGLTIWEATRELPERFWCFYNGFGVLAWKVQGKNVGLSYDKLGLFLFNPTGRGLERIELDFNSLVKRIISMEMAHCLVEEFANDSDRAFYGDFHEILISGERVELPNGVGLQRGKSLLNCWLMSQHPRRLDFVNLFDEKMGLK